MKRIDGHEDLVVLVDRHRQPQADTEENGEREIIHEKFRRKGIVVAVFLCVLIIGDAQSRPSYFARVPKLEMLAPIRSPSGEIWYNVPTFDGEGAHRAVPDRLLEV